MSVPKPKRDTGRLEVDVKATELASYTLKITANAKTFTPEHRDLAEMIRKTALDISILVFTANEIVVKNSETRYRERLLKQEEAAIKCNELYQLIEIAKPVFRLRAKRCYYWQTLVINVRGLIRAWQSGDITRMKPKGSAKM